MCFYLIYTSKANDLMPADELVFLLEQSRRNNLALDITGILLYMETRFLSKLEGRFIQLLEGPEPQLKLIYDRIKNDSRHTGVLLLSSGKMIKRRFPDWSMAFRLLNNNSLIDIPGFKKLGMKLFRQPAFRNSDAALDLLSTFYQVNIVDDPL